jgi:hypothetical protein
MVELVYILCAVTGLACAALLARAYSRNPSHMLLWSSVCFAALAINSILVVVDLVLLPAWIDLRIARLVVAAAGLILLLGALIAEAD